MKDLLQPDSRFLRFLSRVCDLLLLNLMLDFLCVTVVFSGAAITSLFSQTLKMVRDEEGETVKGFFRVLRREFIASTPATILLLIDVLLLAVIGYALYAEVMLFSPAVFVLLCVAAVLLTAVISWLFPLLARYKNSFREHLRNAGALALSRLPVTALLTAINLLPFLSVVFFPGAMGYLICFWLLIGMAGCAYLDSLILRRALEALEKGGQCGDV